MRSLMTIFLFTASLLTISAGANALTITEYKKAKENTNKWPITRVYLGGVGVGSSLTASLLVQQGMPPPFCQPKEIALNEKSYIKLIDAFLAKNDIPDDTPVETVLLMALVTAFTCK